MVNKIAELLSTNNYALAVAWFFTVGVPIITFLVSRLNRTKKKAVGELTEDSNLQRPPREQYTYTLSTTIPNAGRLIGRDKDIINIQNLLAEHFMVSVKAEGGVGKTAVAIQIANAIKTKLIKDNTGRFRHIAWITSTGNLKKDLAMLNIPTGNQSLTLEKKYQSVLDYLQDTPTFLVVDNMDEPLTGEEIDQLNTVAGKTTILITTRADIPNIKKYSLKSLDMDSSLILFYSLYKEGDNLELDQIKKREDSIYAKRIIEKVEFNALLLELVGKMAYVEGWKLDNLWNTLENDNNGQDSIFVINTDHAKSHHRNRDTMLAQLGKLYEISKLSKQQIELMSFIILFPAEHSIFLDVFKWAGFMEGKINNLEELRVRGWIERNDTGYLVHTLVKGSIEQQCRVTFDERRYKYLIDKLSDTSSYISKTMAYTALRERFIVSETICRLLIANGSEKYNTIVLLNNIAIEYENQGMYEEALEYNHKVLDIKEKVLGKDHLSTAIAYNNIALAYCNQGMYEDALKYCKKALVIREKVLGTNHPDTATVYNNIAEVYRFQGRFKEALTYYEKALEIRQIALGKDHPDTAETCNNIAGVYQDLNRYEDALKYFKRALTICKAALGEDHPDTATTYNNIAIVYDALGKNRKAQEYFEKSLAIRKKVLREGHPYIIATYNNMAVSYNHQGRYKEALEYYEKSLKYQEQEKGENHPDVAKTYCNIAAVYDAQGLYKDAMEHYINALVIFEKVFGVEHILTAVTYCNIGALFAEMGDNNKAKDYLQKALPVLENTLGPEHLYTVQAKEKMEYVRDKL